MTKHYYMWISLGFSCSGCFENRSCNKSGTRSFEEDNHLKDSILAHFYIVSNLSQALSIGLHVSKHCKIFRQ